jgi:pSer/pThr/pTyr-binding forkhead associated (FHA) protein
MWLINTEEQAESPFTFRILPGAIKTIGRAPASDFRVEAALVSRLHCRLTAGAAELEVVDLESTNGTFVNGARVDRAVLKSGDRLAVGKIEFVVSRAVKTAESFEDAEGSKLQLEDPPLTATREEER